MEIAATATLTTISSRRGSTMSVSAPAGTVKRNSGRLVAAWTSETSIGSWLKLVMNQPVAVSNIAIPTFETMLAVHMTTNAEWANAPQRCGSAPGVDAAELVCAVKSVSA